MYHLQILFAINWTLWMNNKSYRERITYWAIFFTSPYCSIQLPQTIRPIKLEVKLDMERSNRHRSALYKASSLIRLSACKKVKICTVKNMQIWYANSLLSQNNWKIHLEIIFGITNANKILLKVLWSETHAVIGFVD